MNDESTPVAALQGAARPASRRRLMVAVAAAAGLGGLGVGLYRRQMPAPRPAEPPVPGFEAALAAFWALELPSPQGETVALQRFRGHPLVVNFWATWCPPCVEELPLLDNYHRAHSVKGWVVLGVAVDQAAPVRAFLQKTPLRLPMVLAGTGGAELSRSLGNLAGALPFTVVLKADGQVVQRKMGKVNDADMKAWNTAFAG